MADFIEWRGQRASVTYRYWFVDNPSTLSDMPPQPGNYMFVRPVNAGWLPVYAGIADDLAERLTDHEMWSRAYALGATRIMAHTNHNEANRKAEEQDLIGYWNPPLNTQHRTTRRSLIGGGSGF